MSDKHTKVIAYCRVASAVQQQDDKAYETQKYQLNKAAANSNHEIVAWFEDLGSATDPFSNSELQEAHDFCMDNPEIKHLLATEPNRISRTLEGFYYWQHSFSAHGVTFRFTNMNVEDYEQHLINMAVKGFITRNRTPKKAKEA
ncbi:MAG TPA: recombinase family protein [Candidatus Saccharimonadales bacterium]|nr:recombinase family protein [Candidatus Saccharimonadales bacterium]